MVTKLVVHVPIKNSIVNDIRDGVILEEKDIPIGYDSDGYVAVLKECTPSTKKTYTVCHLYLQNDMGTLADDDGNKKSYSGVQINNDAIPIGYGSHGGLGTLNITVLEDITSPKRLISQKTTKLLYRAYIKYGLGKEINEGDEKPCRGVVLKTGDIPIEYNESFMTGASIAVLRDSVPSLNKIYSVHSIRLENDMGKFVDDVGIERRCWGICLEDGDVPVTYYNNSFGHYVLVLRDIELPPKRMKSYMREEMEHKVCSDVFDEVIHTGKISRTTREIAIKVLKEGEPYWDKEKQ